MATTIPRSSEDDYSDEAAAERLEFAREASGSSLEHVGSYSFDAGLVKGNVEHFTGVAQVPIGLAGPLLMNGEHAQGEFYVPMATTEGTLVASYNRGMKLVREAGGATVTVVDDAMQRAPVFGFESARGARDFIAWLGEHLGELVTAADETTSSGHLRDVERYAAGRFAFLRFNYTTGDGAGQNMTGKATMAACEWIQANYDGDVTWFSLEGGMATDKKHSQMNVLRTRGKRVVAEATIPNELFERLMRTTSETIYRARQVNTLGSLLSDTNNNGAHSANGITAMFIACGQDVANVAESSAALAYAELLPNGDYYYSITLPALIVATYGGGTGLATQRECLELLGCHGKGNVRKFAEIVAATVLCGELSLGSAVVAGDWVSSHDKYGRNRS